MKMSKTVTYNDVTFTLTRDNGWDEYRCHVCNAGHMIRIRGSHDDIAQSAMRHAIQHNNEW